MFNNTLHIYITTNKERNGRMVAGGNLIPIQRLLSLTCPRLNATKGIKFSTPETSGRLSTSVLRWDIWDRLGNYR